MSAPPGSKVEEGMEGPRWASGVRGRSAPAAAYTQVGFQLIERATTYVLPPQDGQPHSCPAMTAEVNPSAVRQGGRA